MSQENVELARRVLEAWKQSAEAAMEYATPDCVLYPDPNWMEEEAYRGRDAVLAFNQSQMDAFGEFRTEVRDVRAVGDRVLALVEFVGRARGSGVPVRQKAAHVFSDFREGKIGEDHTFLSWDAALKAVGLVE